MRNLNSGRGALPVNEAGYPFQKLYVLVLPDSVILGRDAAARLDSTGFHDYQGGAPDSAAAKVHHVPVVREAIDARVLAHRRNCNAIAKLYVSDR
jgi:hypothetical protein